MVEVRQGQVFTRDKGMIRVNIMVRDRLRFPVTVRSSLSLILGFYMIRFRVKVRVHFRVSGRGPLTLSKVQG